MLCGLKDTKDTENKSSAYRSYALLDGLSDPDMDENSRKNLFLLADGFDTDDTRLRSDVLLNGRLATGFRAGAAERKNLTHT